MSQFPALSYQCTWIGIFVASKPVQRCFRLNPSCAGCAVQTNLLKRPDVGDVSPMQLRRRSLSPTGQEQSALSIMLHCNIATLQHCLPNRTSSYFICFPEDRCCLSGRTWRCAVAMQEPEAGSMPVRIVSSSAMLYHPEQWDELASTCLLA